MCEKNLDWFGGRKHKKSLLKTLDKLSFWFENICSKTCGDKHLIEYEKLAQKPTWNLVKNSPREAPFIGFQNMAVGGQISSWRCCRSTARSTGQRSDFWPWASGQPAGRPWPGYREQTLSAGRPPGRPGPFPYSRTLWRSTGSVDRPSSQTRRAHFMHVGSTARSTDF